MLSLVITNLLSASFFDDDIIFMTIIGIIFFGYIYIYISKKIFKTKWFVVSIFLVPFLILSPVWWYTIEVWLGIW